MLKSFLFVIFLANVFYFAMTDECSGDNEEYVECPGCSPQTCDSIGKIYECPLQKCNGGCLCISGYVRNDENECVNAKDTCTSCGGDKNALPGCDNCGRLCSNYQSNDTVCTAQRKYGCECKANYVLDSNTGFCVLPENCTVN